MTPLELPRGVLAVHHIEEGSVPMLRFDRKNLPDLDEVALWLATVDEYGDPRDEYDWTTVVDGGWGDAPTRVHGTPFRDPELPVCWLRISPCPCGGGEHAWHVDYGLHHGDDPTEEPHRPGVFLGLWSAW